MPLIVPLELLLRPLLLFFHLFAPPLERLALLSSQGDILRVVFRQRLESGIERVHDEGDGRPRPQYFARKSSKSTRGF